MKTKTILYSAFALSLLAGCSSMRLGSSAKTEDDDVYVTRSEAIASDRAYDQACVAAKNQQAQAQQAPTATPMYEDDSFAQQRAAHSTQGMTATVEPREAYADDDFYYSRRLRRFDNGSTANWRYYDPYYSNDLYIVLGTPSWNTWYGNGWYNWNQPHFGNPVFYDPFWGMNSTWSYWGGANYGWNPYINAYYGYSPCPWNSWSNGYNGCNYNPWNYGYNSWNSGYANGYNNGFNQG